MKTLTLIVLLILSCTGFNVTGQILMSPPYVLIKDSISGTKWKLKEEKRVEIVLKSTEKIKGRVEFIADDSLALYKQGWISLNEIESIKFKPKSKFRRYFKLVYYTGFVGLTAYTFTSHKSPVDPSAPSVHLLYALFVVPSAVIVGETAGLLIQVMSPAREFRSSEGWKFSVIR